MNNRRLINIISLIVISLLCLQTLQAQESGIADKSAPVEPPSLLSVVAELGNTYDCYFTIEQAWEKDEFENSLVFTKVVRQRRSKDLQSELKDLCQIIPYFTYRINKENPKIVHLMDTRLAKQNNYALDQLTPSINFNGSLYGLVSEICKQGILLNGPSVIALNELKFIDFRTTVNVKADQLPVRNLLSNFIPLKGRSSIILWIAKTKIGEQQSTGIRFYGAPSEDSENSEDNSK